MPLVSPFPYEPLIDGRQSDRAMMVRRGVQRLMIARRVSVLPEMSLASGRRADLVCLSEKGEITIVEIKTSIEDFRVDTKWPDYRLHCDRLYFATHPGVPREIFPESCGLILSDGHLVHAFDADRRIAKASADRLLNAEWAANPYFTE